MDVKAEGLVAIQAKVLLFFHIQTTSKWGNKKNHNCFFKPHIQFYPELKKQTYQERVKKKEDILHFLYETSCHEYKHIIPNTKI